MDGLRKRGRPTRREKVDELHPSDLGSFETQIAIANVESKESLDYSTAYGSGLVL